MHMANCCWNESAQRRATHVGNTKGNCQQASLSIAICPALLHGAQYRSVQPNSQSIVLKIDKFSIFAIEVLPAASTKPEFYLITGKYNKISKY